MVFGKPFILFLFVFIFSGCSMTPQLRLNAGDMTMEVTSKVPYVGAVDYSRDGKYVLSGGWDNIGRLWDLNGAREVTKFRSGPGLIQGVAFLEDGKTAATTSSGVFGGDTTTRLWDMTTGKELKALAGAGGENPSFSPDGEFFLGIEKGFGRRMTKLYSVSTGTVIREFKSYLSKLSPDGKSILLGTWGDQKDGLVKDVSGPVLLLMDLETGAVKWKAAVSAVNAIAFSRDGKYIAVARNDKPGPRAPMVASIRLVDASTGGTIKEFGHTTTPPGGLISVQHVYDSLGAIRFSPDGRHIMTGDYGGRYKLWDMASGTLVRQMKMVDEISGTIYNNVPSLAFSPDGRFAVAASIASTRIFDVSTGDELGTMIAFENGEWLFITPKGYYNSSEKGDQYLSVTVGGQPYSIAQLRESFYRPDLVKLAIAGGSLKEYRRMADVKQPPTVAIIDTPGSVSVQETTVTLKVTDTGGGIGDIRLYLNGSAVVLDNRRGVAVVPAARTGEVIRKYPVKLTNGNNELRAIAFNGDNSMQSSDALQTITAAYQTAARPSLYALVIGINEYRNPKLQLNFAVADAGLFADTLGRAAEPLFQKIFMKKLLTRDETTQENILKELRSFRSLNPDDLFVFYVASHGTVDDGEYFLITSNVGSLSTVKLRTDAISQNALKEIVANIPATKKLIVIDTCSAGKLGDAIQTAMLTRGMSEDTALKVLSRAVGSTILSASTSVQEALEGYQGHGLFTYVLADGLNGKADKGGTGFVKTTELADYVDNEVPLLAEKVFKRPQYPTISISGQAFPIGKTR